MWSKQHGYKTPGMQKECHKAAWRERGIKPSTTEAPSTHSKRSAARATRTRDQLQGNIRPRRDAPSATEWPAETLREDAIRSPQWCLPTSTAQDGLEDLPAPTPPPAPRG